jgi:hypothetical protein
MSDPSSPAVCVNQMIAHVLFYVILRDVIAVIVHGYSKDGSVYPGQDAAPRFLIRLFLPRRTLY